MIGVTGQDDAVEASVTGKATDGFEPAAGSRSVAVFVGDSESSGGDTGLALGLDIGYRVTDSVGVGAFAERVSGLERTFSAGGQIYWVTPQKLVLFVGLGAERREGKWDPILRTGIEYEWCQPSGWVISPSVFYDAGRENDLVVFGVSVGRFL